MPPLPPDFEVNSVWAHNGNDIFVTGRLTTYANGSDRFFRWNGASWTANNRGAALFRQSIQFATASTGIPGDDVSDIAYDPSSDLFWVALEDFGLASVDVDGALWRSYSPTNGLVSRAGFSVAVNAMSDVWFGGQDGASCILGSTGKITSYPQGSGLPTVRVRRVYVTPNAAQEVWMGFVEAGAGQVIKHERP
jgi:hypothetical protein